MSLLFFDGCADALLQPPPEWSFSGAGVTPVAGRFGDANGGFTLANGATRTLTLPGANTFVCGFAHRVTNFATSGNSSMTFGLVVGGTVRIVLTTTGAGLVEARLDSNTGTVIATAVTAPLSSGVWAHVQIKAVAHLTTGTLVVRVNGTTVINFSGKTSNATGQITGIQVTSGVSGTGFYSFDDLWVCNEVDGTSTQGRPNNDFLGDLKVAQLLPTVAGASTQWTPSAGTNVSTVDETPPNTTDYVTAATAALRDSYEVADLPTTTTTVYGLRVGTYAIKMDAGAASISPLIRESGGAVTVSAAKALPIAFGGVYGDPQYLKSGGGVFTAADVNGLQIGMDSA